MGHPSATSQHLLVFFTPVNVFCHTDSLILRRAESNDATAIAAFKRDPLVREMALGSSHENGEARDKEDIERASADEGQLYLVIVLRDEERPIGYVRVNWIDKPRFAWLRFALGAERGKGYMRAALAVLLARLFDEGLHRVDAEAYAFNEPSIRLMERLGFRCEGRKREAHYDGDGYSDVLVFGLLREDFEAAQPT